LYNCREKPLLWLHAEDCLEAAGAQKHLQLFRVFRDYVAQNEDEIEKRMHYGSGPNEVMRGLDEGFFALEHAEPLAGTLAAWLTNLPELTPLDDETLKAEIAALPARNPTYDQRLMIGRVGVFRGLIETDYKFALATLGMMQKKPILIERFNAAQPGCSVGKEETTGYWFKANGETMIGAVVSAGACYCDQMDGDLLTHLTNLPEFAAAMGSPAEQAAGRKLLAGMLSPTVRIPTEAWKEPQSFALFHNVDAIIALLLHQAGGGEKPAALGAREVKKGLRGKERLVSFLLTADDGTYRLDVRPKRSATLYKQKRFLTRTYWVGRGKIGWRTVQDFLDQVETTKEGLRHEMLAAANEVEGRVGS
ncbi:MAG: hypothetical protein AAGI70_00670, partial [Pseudomonadota bacterium]